MKTNRQSGFTLIEIAIVLVVIGLLLGGILKGQQLINSARVRNLADQYTGVQAAYYSFFDRFKNLPGDMRAAAACSNISSSLALCGAAPYTGATLGGNGNGLIDTIAEAGAVWGHLSAAQFLNGTFSGTDTTPAVLSAASYPLSVPTGGVPANAYQGPILLGHMVDYMDGVVEGTVVRLAYSFGGHIPVPILRDLDQKLDDGISGTGLLRSAFGQAVPAGTFGLVVEATTAAGNTCNNLPAAPAKATWNVDSTNQTCNAIFLD